MLTKNISTTKYREKHLGKKMTDKKISLKNIHKKNPRKFWAHVGWYRCTEISHHFLVKQFLVEILYLI